jgi:putative restriction endonuclease
MCGVQLEMVDAAHIIPVAADTSNDETRNGIALCKLHHASYDRNLISFDEKYRVEVSDERALYLTQNDRAAGLQSFRENLLPVIRMPYDRRDYPPATYIAEARRVRRWVT